MYNADEVFAYFMDVCKDYGVKTGKGKGEIILKGEKIDLAQFIETSLKGHNFLSDEESTVRPANITIENKADAVYIKSDDLSLLAA